ncbi:tetratricopeptide repeat protein [Flavobacterium sp. xlx-214]|uniref:tetratricopeptide repeat protein n=1 Tax=unclassified Flavobacterium TaxID=196869 RepID=UPI0013D7C74D|nr:MULTISPECIES: tetratricopeptide repeat protein [unclassified Flavobacterium]MBA5793679.1 tetratricopeptide repeat protein [Flavobacterium sp. xlx-221]QMI83296.1 tetratricopeptide repeat protein [Flavobacterium sp. xlx-214]
MKNKLILISMFFLTCFSFAQKNELKDLEKAIKKNNTEEITSLLVQLDPLMASATDDQKAAFYYFKAQNEITLANNGTNISENRSKAIETLKKLFALENETKTKKYTTEATTLKNDFLAMLVNEAVENNQKKEFNKSSRLFEQAYQISPTDTVYLFYAASDASNGKDFDYAESKYKELAKLNYDGKSETYVATSQITGKAQSFGIDKKARDLAIKNGTHVKPETITTKSVKPEIYNNITLILLNKENYSEAESFALKAYSLDKNNINTLMNVLLLYYKTNRMDKYEEFANKGLEQFPDNETLLYNLAVIHFENNKLELAKSYFEKIIKNNPNHFESLKALGNIELQKDADITNKINALPNTTSSNKKRNDLMESKKTVYNNALNYYKQAQKINNKDIGLKELVTQIELFLKDN